MGYEIIGDKIGKDYGTVSYEGKRWRKSKASWPTGDVYQYEEIDQNGNSVIIGGFANVFYTPLNLGADK